jgi:hypothetical protein
MSSENENVMIIENEHEIYFHGIYGGSCERTFSNKN